ncbi:MAG: LysM domain-containing protein [Chloroflexota bacterium]|nr:MAG: LysM domain-containing protein [Chloroflexota bacterium]
MKILTSRYAQIGLALIIAVLLIAGISTSASASGPVYHTVQPGQTLYSIAQWYGTSVWAISCANGLFNPNYVYAGQVLLIPSGWGGGCQPAHKPVPQPVHYKPHPGPKPLGCFYTVRWGDHLFRIALRYNIPWTVLAQANGLHNGNYIYAGQVLRVPCVW